MNVKIQLGKSVITDKAKNTIYPPTEEIPLIENTGVYQNGVYTGWKTKKADHSTGNEYPEIIDDDNIYTRGVGELVLNGEKILSVDGETTGIEKVFFQKEVIDVMAFSGDEKELHYRLEKGLGSSFIFRKISQTENLAKTYVFDSATGDEYVLRAFFPKSKDFINLFFIVTQKSIYKVFIDNTDNPDVEEWSFVTVKIVDYSESSSLSWNEYQPCVASLLANKEAEVIYEPKINAEKAFILSSVVIPCDGVTGIYEKLNPYRDKLYFYLINGMNKRQNVGENSSYVVKYVIQDINVGAIPYAPYFSGDSIYMAEIHSDTEIYPIKYVISNGYTEKGEIVSSTTKIVEWGACFSEFEFWADKKAYYRTPNGFTAHDDCIESETELIGYKNGYLYHTINGIPRVIESMHSSAYLDSDVLSFGSLVGGFTGEIVSICGYNFFYQDDGRCFYFKKDSNKEESMQLLKKGWIKLKSSSNPNIFSQNRDFSYSSVAFTGAIVCDYKMQESKSLRGESDNIALVTGYNGTLSSSLHLPKIVRCKEEFFDTYSVVQVKMPRFVDTANWHNRFPPIFDLYCSNFGETLAMTYRYSFGFALGFYQLQQVNQLKMGSIFVENTYNRLIPIPAWASKIKNGVAIGGDQQFLLATDPKTRGKTPSIFLNYFIESSFDYIQACFSLSGNKYVQSENTILGVEVDPQGAIIKATPYSDRVKMRYIGKSVDSAFFVSDFNNKIYRYTGFWELSPFLTFSNRKRIDTAYILDSHGVFILDSKKEKKVVCIYDGNIFEIEKEGQLFGSIQSNGKALFIKTKDENGPSYLKEYNLLSNKELEKHKQESFSLQTGYIGFNYNLVLVRNISLLFYCKNYEGEIAITYRSNLPDVDIPPQKEIYTITQEDLLIDDEEHQYFRINLKPRTQRVQSFSLQVSIPSIEKTVNLSNIGLFSITADINEGEKILLSENLSK